MEPQGWVELANSPLPITDGTALASSAALTAISSSAATNPTWTAAANRWFPGAVVRCYASGRMSNVATTPTLLIGLYYGGAGGTSLANTGAITTTTAPVTNVTWNAEFYVTCRGIGTSGLLFCTGWVTGISGTGGVSTVQIPATAPASATVDTTAAKSLDLCAQWGTSAAGNSIQCHTFTIEALNVNMA